MMKPILCLSLRVLTGCSLFMAKVGDVPAGRPPPCNGHSSAPTLDFVVGSLFVLGGAALAIDESRRPTSHNDIIGDFSNQTEIVMAIGLLVPGALELLVADYGHNRNVECREATRRYVPPRP